MGHVEPMLMLMLLGTSAGLSVSFESFGYVFESKMSDERCETKLRLVRSLVLPSFSYGSVVFKVLILWCSLNQFYDMAMATELDSLPSRSTRSQSVRISTKPLNVLLQIGLNYEHLKYGEQFNDQM